MFSEIARLRCAVEEYRALLDCRSGGCPPETGDTEWERYESILSGEADWTPRGAEAVVWLAWQYGA